MKKSARIFFLCLVHTLFLCPAVAQDAFYIYQNDGHFDGFFFDEVESISYTCTDTLGRTFAFPVAQEIVTADSTYRIMLTAIDSVSFVQPEIRFSSQLRRMDELGMTDFITEQNGMRVTFSGSLPSSLHPSVGDVLASFDFERFEGGLVGVVRSVGTGSGGIVVELDSISDLGQIFEQFVTVEEYAPPREPGEKPRYRMAGLDHIRGDEHRRAARAPIQRLSEGKFDTDALSFAHNFHVPYDGNGWSASLDIGVNAQTQLKSVWKIDVFGDKMFKYSAVQEFELKPSFTLKGKVIDDLTFGAKFIPPIYLPAAAPVFNAKLTFLPFIRLNAYVSLQFSTTTQKWKRYLSYEFNNWQTTNSDKSELSPTPVQYDLSLSAEGFIQAGLKASFGFSTIAAVEKAFKAGIEFNLWAGPKLTASISADLFKAGSDLYEGNGLSAYRTLKGNSKASLIPLSIDYELKALIKGFWMKNDTTTHTLLDGSIPFGERTFWLFPEFKNFNVTPSTVNPYTVVATATPTRELAWPQHLGFELLNERGESVETAFLIDSIYRPWGARGPFMTTFNKLSPGRYTIRPAIRLLLPTSNIDVATDIEKTFTVPKPQLDLSPNKLNFPKSGGKKIISVATTLDRINVTNVPEWATVTVEPTQISVDVKSMAAGVTTDRKATLRIVGEMADGAAHTEQPYVITQFAKEITLPSIEVRPRLLEFGTEADSRTVELTSNCESLTASCEDEWVHVNLSGELLTVGVDATDDLDERSTTIVITGSNEKGEATAIVVVKQKGLVSIVPRVLNFEADGGSIDITIDKPDRVSIDFTVPKDWIELDKAADHLTVRSEANYQVYTRRDTIYALAITPAGEKRLPIYINQTPYIELTPSEIKCDNDGGVFDLKVKTKLTNVDIQAVLGWIGLGLTDNNTRLTVSVDENATKMPRTGHGVIQGRKGNETISLYVPVYQGYFDEEDTDDWDIEEPRLAFSTYGLTISQNSDPHTIDVYTNCDNVQIQNNCDFLSRCTLANKQLTLSAYYNNTSEARMGTIAVTATNQKGSITRLITVIQEGNTSPWQRDYVGVFVALDNIPTGSDGTFSQTLPGTDRYGTSRPGQLCVPVFCRAYTDGQTNMTVISADSWETRSTWNYSPYVYEYGSNISWDIYLNIDLTAGSERITFGRVNWYHYQYQNQTDNSADPPVTQPVQEPAIHTISFNLHDIPYVTSSYRMIWLDDTLGNNYATRFFTDFHPRYGIKTPVSHYISEFHDNSNGGMSLSGNPSSRSLGSHDTEWSISVGLFPIGGGAHVPWGFPPSELWRYDAWEQKKGEK